jgi:hypothetical protein
MLFVSQRRDWRCTTLCWNDSNEDKFGKDKGGENGVHKGR